MKIAYHFDADSHGGSYGYKIERLFFAALRNAPANRLHVRVKHGDLLLHLTIRDAHDREKFLQEQVLKPEHPVWTTCDLARFSAHAARNSVYILYLDGLSSGDAKRLDRRLAEDDAYLGCLEIDLANPVHWALYDEQLISAYRVVGTELRLLHIAAELEPDLPTGAKRDWAESGLFERVEFEDTGLQETILDPYDSVAAARRTAELEEVLSGHFSAVVTVTLIRTGELDPHLRDGLHAALTSFDSFESSEQLAHVATSCRRFLERLADSLFPARAEPRGERQLTQAHYLNRLWAYVDDNLKGTGRNLVISTLTDIGSRVDRLHDLANKGVHAPKVEPSEMQRLLVGLVSTTYDVLTLAPPPTKARMEPYTDSVAAFAQRVFEPTDEA